MEKTLKIILIFFKGIIYLIPVLLLGWLLFKDIVWSGEIMASYDFKNLSPFITVLRPQSRLSEPQTNEQGDSYQIIKEEPVYFDVRLPRHFDTAELTVKYKNLDQPIIQVGAMTDPEKWLFDLKPLDNKIVNNLFNDKLHWSTLIEGETILFQKDSKYKNISDFLDDLPLQEKIATYNYKLDNDFKIFNYQPSQKELIINKSLRGPHRFYTYIKDEPLNLKIVYQDVNRHLGDDYLDIKIYFKDQIIYSKFLIDDGNTTDNWQLSEPKKIEVNLPNLSEGVYRIELIGNDDIFIRRLETSQRYLVFIDQIYLADNVAFYSVNSEEREKPTWLYTNGHKITAYTSHKEGLQNLALDYGFGRSQILEIKETHKNFSILTPFGLKSILVPKNDILIKTKGLFAISQESFFNPQITSLADGEAFDEDKIDYIIADYQLPKAVDSWNIKKINFKIDKYFTADDKLHFIISLPNLNEGQQGVVISEVKVVLKKEPLTFKIFLEKLNRYFKFLISKS